MVKTYLVGLTIFVKALCHYYVTHVDKINANIAASSMSPAGKLACNTFFSVIVEVCDNLRLLTGY